MFHSILHAIVPTVIICGSIGIFLGLFYLIFLRKGENKAKLFRKTIKVGDQIKYHVSQIETPEGEIVDIDPCNDGNFVKITTIIPKHFIYPCT